MQNLISDTFSAHYGSGAQFYASAGRINLIGEHTDYNGAFVMPGAIDKGMMAAIKPNGSRTARVFSVDFNEECSFGIDSDNDAPAPQWARYIFGVCRELAARGAKLEGFDAVFAGDVPIGSGLSSSAALEVCFAYALNDLYGCGLSRLRLTQSAQAAEQKYCGVKCGIMDQFASCFGRKGQLIRLNCSTLEYEYHPFEPKGYRLLLVDSRVKHTLASSAYNDRRASCEHALAALKEVHPEVESLGVCPRIWLEDVKGKISGEDFMRAEYVIAEQGRVLDVCDALDRGDYESVGELMYQTHHGLSKVYEVSCPELDFLNALARKCGVTGSRIMGGGFGGCTINLVADGLYDDFKAEALKSFTREWGHEPKFYDVVISDGARKL